MNQETTFGEITTMSTARTLRSYDYVNRPVSVVLEALQRDAPGIFSRATSGAAERERALGVQLRMRIGVVDVTADIQVEVGPQQGPKPFTAGHEVTAFPLTWRSAKTPSLFPYMRARLLIYPLSSHETQLELDGEYDPPLGMLGDAIDSVIGHRVAEACVLRFVQDVAAQLRTELPEG